MGKRLYSQSPVTITFAPSFFQSSLRLTDSLPSIMIIFRFFGLARYVVLVPSLWLAVSEKAANSAGITRLTDLVSTSLFSTDSFVG